MAAFGVKAGKLDEHLQSPPIPYAYDYNVKDEIRNTDFAHRESSNGQVVSGEYFVALADGSRQVVEYKVDPESGYTAKVSYEGGSRKRSSQRPRSVANNSPSVATASSPAAAAQISPSSLFSPSNSDISSGSGGAQFSNSVFVSTAPVSSSGNQAVPLNSRGTPRITPQFPATQSASASSGGIIRGNPNSNSFVAAPVNSDPRNFRPLTGLTQNSRNQNPVPSPAFSAPPPASSPQGLPPQTAARQEEIFVVSLSDNLSPPPSLSSAQSNPAQEVPRFNSPRTQFLTSQTETGFVPINQRPQSRQPITNSRNPPSSSSFRTSALNSQSGQAPIRLSNIPSSSNQQNTFQSSTNQQRNFQQTQNFQQVTG
ncbi:hypothetical protein Pmani_021627 [Petrolisthes manimaculis]|uniref:Cuticle protein n=1 Tax=Petrolisthes manimaculis TaxID=1843537 RepID=A0AAE1PEF5_9EUCA|nr:hypothetical protein Pmani_021627 [Petrolisthes manimaculis]